MPSAAARFQRGDEGEELERRRPWLRYSTQMRILEYTIRELCK